ncbi:MAG: hypothetical protein DCF25_14135 [Leptolyngbya foveolarum]|uniref:Uncharacterized protein n=1 Tax=Leptolyngbya foveolarum TaxID=47253 RepID=A0A2W4U7T7_9CYAN|nr:MAG: hypothetical protein DCF25_14135 [Leptolyngbya foveolarum]
MNGLLRALMVSLIAVLISVGFASAEAQANGDRLTQMPQSLIAYSLDYEMDRARADQTIDHYGEPVREVVEETLRNNVNHPDSKATAENSYKRKSFLNDLLPNRNSVGKKFSQDDFSGMRKIEHPRDVLQK